MKNKSHLSEKIENLRENLKIKDEILASLKKKSIDVNIYIDSNHLKTSIDQITLRLQDLNLELCKYHKLESFKSFDLNHNSYGRLIAYIFSSFFHEFEENLINNDKSFFSRIYSPKKIDCGPFLTERVLGDLVYDFEKKLSKNEIFEKFQKVHLRPINEAIHFKVNSYLHFFIGNKPDFSKIEKLLRYKKISPNDALNLILRKRKELEPYTEFKKGLINLNSYWRTSEDMVHEIEYGVTKSQFLFKPEINLKFNEKMVDTKLVIAALDDFHSSQKNTVFVFLTNDSDFQPLFERIKSQYKLYWMCGNEIKYQSKELKEIVDPNLIYSFFERTTFVDSSTIYKDLEFPANYSSLLEDYHNHLMPKSWPDWMD